MSRRMFLAALAAGAATSAAARTVRDVLDSPALVSPLAAKSLVNALARAGSRLVAAGQRGHVLVSDDAGGRWQQARVPVSSDLVALSFPSASKGWAVGHDGVILASSDAGLTWQRQLDGRRSGAQGAENPLLDVWFADERHGYAVGAFGLAFETHDGGTSWSPLLHALANPKGLHLYAVRGIAGETFIAGEQGLLLRLDAVGGLAGRFQAIELPYKGTLFGLVGNARALIVHGLRGTVLRSTDAGRSWTTVPTGVNVGLTASTIDDRGRFVIVSQAGHVLVSGDDGASFRPAPIERAAPAAAVAVAAGRLVLGGPRGLASLAWS